MGFTASNWWYVIESPKINYALGIIKKELFIQLYQYLYIQKDSGCAGKNATYYTMNDYCDNGEFTRYQHQLDCWEELNLSPDS